MHFLALMGAILAGLALLAFGVVSVWHDLTARGPWEAPLVRDDEGWNWSSRYRGTETIESDPAKALTPRVR